MKRFFLINAMLLAGAGAFAQVTVPEPEFINSYCILTSDSTYDVLPKENGTIAQHENKVSKWSKITGKVAGLASSAGIIGMGTAGSVSGVITGARVVTTASGVAGAASAVSGLAGSTGMDIVFSGGSSSYRLRDTTGGARLLIRGESNETDPLDAYRIVRFVKSKKERRVQWMEFTSSLLGTPEAEKGGYVSFSGHKYGEQSYLLIIPEDQLEEGEYGIFYLSIVSATAIPVGTFSVR